MSLNPTAEPTTDARLWFRLDGLLLDLTHQHLPAFEVLAQHYALDQLDQWLADLKQGTIINCSEQRAALHLALRAKPHEHYAFNGVNVLPMVQQVHTKMADFCRRLHAGQVHGATGQPIRDIVHIGVGGSGLGPRVVLEALAPLAVKSVRVHIVTGGDWVELEDVLHQVDPARTLFVLASKSLTTSEPLQNLQTGLQWLQTQLDLDQALIRQHHLLVLTAKPEAAQQLGVADHAIFPLWDWVGGRFSLWSAIGLPIAMAIGVEQFEQLRHGAWMMDQHVQHTPAAHNMPVMMALAGLYNIHHRHTVALSVVAYSYRLRSFASYLQQLEMESNGKRVTQRGEPVAMPTATVVFGGVGSDAQHSYFQLLHQGTWKIASDFIAIAHSEPHAKQHANKLLANCFAQILALDYGDQADVDAAPSHNQQLVCQGQQPSSLILLPALTPYYLGMLIALYEHKTYIQGRILGVNSFDQWGVVLGKKIAQDIEPLFECPQTTKHTHPDVYPWLQEVWARRAEQPSPTTEP